MARRGKKKPVTKATTSSTSDVKEQQVSASTQPDTHEQETTSSTTSSKPSTDAPAWTPIQLEQIKLSEQLDEYIRSFKNKLTRLKFEPTNRELVILFIMNLHPRWRRLVEPFEMSCSEWIEAAAFARLHCDRVSAILGCESAMSNNELFRTPESKALRDSNYFAFTDCPIAVRKAASSIEHLLHKNNTELREKEKNDILAEAAIPSQQLKASMSAIKQQPTVKPSTSSNSYSSEASSLTESDVINAEIAKNSKSKEASPKKKKTNTTSTKASNGSQKSDEKQEQQPATQTKSTTAASKDQVAKQSDKQVAASNSKSPALPTSTDTVVQNVEKVVLPLTAAAAFAQKVDIPVVEKPEGDIIFSEIPSHHKGVNLAFLELTINQMKVRGLLAKLSWGSSAISLDCVKRLGLHVDESDMFCLDTDWGNVSSLGICVLPIQHPADPSICSSMQVQVLPSIYGGKIDLVLGADFFFFFKPALNIKSRSIKFMDKETPYVVDKIQ